MRKPENTSETIHIEIWNRRSGTRSDFSIVIPPSSDSGSATVAPSKRHVAQSPEYAGTPTPVIAGQCPTAALRKRRGG